MTKKERVYHHLMNIARRVVMTAQEAGGRMSARLLASPMMDEVDPNHATPPLALWCARAQCVQMLGKVLRTEYGTISNPVGERFTQQLEIKDFVDCLQPSYPVSRPIDDDEDSTEYVPINELTDADVDAITSRMDKIGDKFHKGADQLRRYHRARNLRAIQ
jgi:hypothetical protein